MLSQKCLYAVRAVFELAKNHMNRGPILRIGKIASAQAIPPRFLEGILNQLKQAGIVESRRGKDGGYSLRRLPSELKVGDVIELIEGPVMIVNCKSAKGGDGCPFDPECVFFPVWERARKALQSAFNSATFMELVYQERNAAMSQHPECLSYAI